MRDFYLMLMVAILAVIAINIRMLKSEPVDIMPLITEYRETIKQRELQIEDLQKQNEFAWEYTGNRCVCLYSDFDNTKKVSREEICKN